jgi:hypothetical protein
VATTRSLPPRSLAGLLASAWPVRIAWFVLPLLAGPGLADALDQRSQPVQLTAQVGLWAGWAMALLASLVPTTVSLTVLRVIAPGAVAVVALASTTAGQWGLSVAAALAATILGAAVAYLPSTGDVMINGSAYGPERRMALRPPAALVIGPVPALWALVFAAAVTGPLLSAAGVWLAGIPLSVLGAVVVVYGCRSLHRLSKRWVVFVPAGFVLHDHFVLVESLLVRTTHVVRLGPAPRDLTGIRDLTAGAAGLALLAEFASPAKIGVRDRSGRIDDVEVTRVAFTPSLPGALLAEARSRGLPVGA